MIAACYSGGKDSLAVLLHVIDLGVPPSKIELHHQDIDGKGEALMDWPCTHAYVKATAAALGIPVVFSWRAKADSCARCSATTNRPRR